LSAIFSPAVEITVTPPTPQVQQTYSIIFTAVGTAPGTEWSVTLGGQTKSSTGYNITFSGLSPGTYSFSITPPSGYEVESVTFPDGSTGGASGTVTVPFQGYNAGLFVYFEKIPTTGVITFVESGLPEEMYVYGNVIATSWSVEVDGTTHSGTAGRPIEVTVATGVSHTFRVNDAKWVNSRGNVVTYTPSPASGTATAGQTVNVTYTPSQY